MSFNSAFLSFLNKGGRAPEPKEEEKDSKKGVSEENLPGKKKYIPPYTPKPSPINPQNLVDQKPPTKTSSQPSMASINQQVKSFNQPSKAVNQIPKEDQCLPGKKKYIPPYTPKPSPNNPQNQPSVTFDHPLKNLNQPEKSVNQMAYSNLNGSFNQPGMSVNHLAKSNLNRSLPIDLGKSPMDKYDLGRQIAMERKMKSKILVYSGLK